MFEWVRFFGFYFRFVEIGRFLVFSFVCFVILFVVGSVLVSTLLVRLFLVGKWVG